MPARDLKADLSREVEAEPNLEKKDKKVGAIDVVVCTLQSIDKLKDCLDSILREIPVNKLIVVDGGSTDGTLDILKQYQVELYVRPDLNLGQSREFAFSKVTTEWFAVIDSDVVLRKGWFQRMIADIDKGDLIEGGTINHWAIPAGDTNQAGRAHFFNTLLRTAAVRGVKLNCPHLEEELTRRYAESRGYKLYKNGCMLSDHYSNPVRYNSYNDDRYKPFVTQESYPDWVPLERGRIDAISGVTFFAAIARFLYYSLFDTPRTLFRKMYNDQKMNMLYLRGYMTGKKEERVVSNKWRIGVREFYKRTKSE